MRTGTVLLSQLPLSLLASGCFLTGPENVPPTVNITQPANRLVVDIGESVEIIAEASDSDGVVVAVSFLVDGMEIGRDTDSPFEATWETSGEAGWRHSIQAVVEDDGGAEATSSVAVYTSWICEPPEQVVGGWETASLESVGMDPAPFVTLMNSLRNSDDHRMHGVLIARYGQLVFEQYFDGYRRDDQNTLVRFDRETVHDLASATKSVTSALLGIAIDRGFIESVGQSVFEFFPDIPSLNTGPKAEISLEHMITMSSGLQWDQHTYPPLDPRNDLVLFALSVEPWSMYLGRPMASDPGTVMNYSEASINVAGEAIRRSSGLRLDHFADDYLFEALGISDRWWNVKWGGWVWASGDLFLRPRDMLKFGQLYLQGGVWEGEQLVPGSWIERASLPYFVFNSSFSAHERHMAATAGVFGYSYAWWILDPDTYGENAYSAIGWGDQRIMVLPAFDMVVVFTGGSQWEPPLLTAHEMMLRYVLPSIQPAVESPSTR